MVDDDVLEAGLTKASSAGEKKKKKRKKSRTSAHGVTVYNITAEHACTVLPSNTEYDTGRESANDDTTVCLGDKKRKRRTSIYELHGTSLSCIVADARHAGWRTSLDRSIKTNSLFCFLCESR